MTALQISPGQLPLDALRAVWAHPVPVALDREAKARVDAAAMPLPASSPRAHRLWRQYRLRSARAHAHRPTRLAELQRASCCRIRPARGPRSDAVVRLTLLLKIASLARGYSGVRTTHRCTAQAAQRGRLSDRPGQGSVGASGDLAPLAHLAGVLIGDGEARVGAVPAERPWHVRASADRAAAKEGLSLINGTQVSTALALAGLFAAERTLAAALVAGALSVDACLGTDTPFDPRIQQCGASPVSVRPNAARLFAGSAIRARTRTARASRTPIRFAASRRSWAPALTAALRGKRSGARPTPYRTILWCFPNSDEVLSGGNFHAEPVAMAADVWRSQSPKSARSPSGATALLTDANLSRPAAVSRPRRPASTRAS